MQITKYTDYSIRVLIYLAVNGEELCTISDIADAYGISKNHLMKIVQALNAQGYLVAIRGKNGGLHLNGEATAINLGALVRDIEGETNLVECFGPDNKCVITENCELKNIFSEAQQSFFQTLDKYTLQDLVKPKQKVALRNLLSINDAKYKNADGNSAGK